MQTTLAVEDVKMSLPELLDQLSPGDEIILTRGRKPVARLIGEQPVERQRRVPGNCKGMITLAAEDDAHPEHFAEYVP
jgi:antitoxin (DNA-binding transcriptional repressor) of toxin-antitoxin stability system